MSGFNLQLKQIIVWFVPNIVLEENEAGFYLWKATTILQKLKVQSFNLKHASIVFQIEVVLVVVQKTLVIIDLAFNERPNFSPIENAKG